MNDSLDFLDKLEQQAAERPTRKGRGKGFSTGLETVSHRAAEHATGGKRMAGRHMRYTAYPPPETIGRLEEIAADIRLSHADTARRFVEHTIAPYGGGLRPGAGVGGGGRGVERG